jgi:hypothetical protein
MKYEITIDNTYPVVIMFGVKYHNSYFGLSNKKIESLILLMFRINEI